MAVPGTIEATQSVGNDAVFICIRNGLYRFVVAVVVWFSFWKVRWAILSEKDNIA
jgi:hypothetical protein